MTTTLSTRRVHLASIQTSFLHHGYFILHDANGTPFYYHFLASGEIDVLGGPPLFGIDVSFAEDLTHLVMDDASAVTWYVVPTLGTGNLQILASAPAGAGWTTNNIVMAAGTILLYFDLHISGGPSLQVTAHAGPGLEGTLVQQAAFHLSAGSIAPVFDALFWEPRLVHPGEFTTSVLGSIETVIDAPAGIPRFGVLEMANADGGFDSMLTSFSPAGHELVVYDGRDNDQFADFTQRYVSRIRSIEWDLDSVRVIVADKFRGLNIPIQTTLYEGTGQLEGETDLVGRGKPITIGTAFNVTPVRVDLNGGSPVYQVHDGTTNSITVYDAGIVLTNAGDISTLSLGSMYAWTAVGGEYVTDLAQGAFRLGVDPVGILTADVEAPPLQAVDALRDIVTTRAGLLDPDDLDTAKLDLLATDRNFFIGIYIPDGTTTPINTVLNDICTAIVSLWAFTPDGRFTARTFGTSSFADPNIIEDQHVLSFRKLPSPTLYWQIRVGFQRVFTVQLLNEVGTLATPARKNLVAKEYRYVVGSNQSLLTQAPDAQPLEWRTLLTNLTEAQITLAFLQDLLGMQRHLNEVELAAHQYVHDIGDVPSIALSRYGLVGTTQVNAPQILEITENLVEETTRLILWG